MAVEKHKCRADFTTANRGVSPLWAFSCRCMQAHQLNTSYCEKPLGEAVEEQREGLLSPFNVINHRTCWVQMYRVKPISSPLKSFENIPFSAQEGDLV